MTRKYVIITNDDPHQTLVGSERWETIHGGRVPPQPFYVLRVKQKDIEYPGEDKQSGFSFVTINPSCWEVPSDRQDEYIFDSLPEAQKALAEKIQNLFPWITEINTRKLPVVEAQTFYGEPRQDEEHPEIPHLGGVVTIMMVL